MIPLPLPWLEAAILIALIGALTISRVRNLDRAWRWGAAFTGAVLACSMLASLGFYLQEWTGTKTAASHGSLQGYLFGRPYLELDELNAPLVPAAALLHFLTAVATARTKMRRFSLTWSLSAEVFHLAKFACTEPMVLIGLLTLGATLPLVEFINRNRPIRVYVLHMSMFVALLLAGGIVLDQTGNDPARSAIAAVLLLAAVLIRCGVVPAHCWITDWFEHASFGIALLYVIPLSGVYAAIRLVLPIAPDWILHGIGLMSLLTAFYAASMALIQREVRRFFAYFFLSHASLVLVGLQLHTAVALTAALSLWLAVILSLGGFGLVLRALESRFGPLSLHRYHGLYEHSPMLAVSFLLTGLASVGFPGTFGFVAADLLVEGALGANLFVGLVVIATGALNGIAILRVYFLLFTGARHTSSVSLELGPRERIMVLTLSILLLGGGVFPQPGITSRRRAAEAILNPSSSPSHPPRPMPCLTILPTPRAALIR
jgi:NADH-quinone oxidoreductase subunit M